MGDDKSPGGMGSRERDRELLIPVGGDPVDGSESKASSSASASGHHHSGREAFYKVIRSWASKKFMTGCVILFPIAVTFYITWWFIRFVDGFFSPIYAQLGINIFGLGFVTSITFIFLVGVFMSSWLGASVLGLGEWFIKRMPFVRHIYNASKQISAAISPDQNTQAFKEVAIIRHPRIGEYAFGFITSTLTLQTADYYQSDSGEEELVCVYVPTNHLYIGDIFMINSRDVIRPNLSVREGIGNCYYVIIFNLKFSSDFTIFCVNFKFHFFLIAEIVVSGGMSMPQILSTSVLHANEVDRIRTSRC
ncbi:hypothetical protein AXF42_Ash020353 [Apostasia shenzhenica]|uniref:Protein CONTINUOUS VASCULAR RING 1 n=2 Tax=Magnoliopsida TaxID=3398 RepID=A0A2I0BAD6_9ASPA|nr:hypothetical protein AXF42_Ash020353 [Apostasia shenzhenica]